MIPNILYSYGCFGNCLKHCPEVQKKAQCTMAGAEGQGLTIPQNKHEFFCNLINGKMLYHFSH